MQLQSVSNAVARGMPAEDVARTVLREGLESLGAGAGVVAVVDEDGASIRVIASSGYSDERMAAFQRFAIDGDLPMAEAVRLREPIIIPTADELRSRYPRVADLIREDGSSVVLPLLFEEHAIGALYFRFRETRTFDADDRAYFLTLGRQCASAMVRARLAEAERAATARLAFLARAGTVLNASLDVDETLVRLSRLVVPEIADWCAVHALEPDRSLRLVEVAPSGAARQALLDARQPSLGDERGVGAVIRTGVTEHAPAVDAATLASLVPGAAAVNGQDDNAADETLSYAIIPLGARGRTLGSLALVARGRPLGGAELQLAEELATRAGMALDNARLYRELADREARRSAVARLGQQAIGLGTPARLPGSAVRELIATAAEVEEAVVLQAVDDGVRIAAAASRSRSGALRTAPDSSDDPTIRGALTGLRVVAVPGSCAVPIRTSAGAWGVFVATARERRPLPDGVVAFIVELAAVLGEAFDRARRLEEERRAQELGRAFIGVVSHELRTPITSIYAGAKLLRRLLPGGRDGVDGRSTAAAGAPEAGRARAAAGADTRDQHLEIVSDVEAEADRLYRLTEDLLVLTRLERNDLEIGREPVLVSRLLERVVQSERAQWPLVDFEVRIEPALPTAVGEDNYVEQVLRNLLSNAAKYSPRGTTIEVEAARGEDGGTVVRVLDRGPGVAAGDRERLFSLFYRDPATASQASGAGIGLFVCEQLVRAMGGRLWAERREGGGSEFGFALLPYLDVDEEDAAAPPTRVELAT